MNIYFVLIMASAFASVLMLDLYTKTYYLNCPVGENCMQFDNDWKFQGKVAENQRFDLSHSTCYGWFTYASLNSTHYNVKLQNKFLTYEKWECNLSKHLGAGNQCQSCYQTLGGCVGLGTCLPTENKCCSFMITDESSGIVVG